MCVVWALFLAFDVRSADEQAKFLANLRNRGVEATGSGANSIRLRPMLIFAPAHAAILLQKFEETIKELPN